MNIFLKEIREFSKNNWWIYIIFFIFLSTVFVTDSGNIIEIILVFLFHFLGDIFMMMMGDYYSKKDLKKGSLSQIGGFLTFVSIGVYSGIRNGKWNYLLPQALFIWPSLKGYFVDIKKKKVDFLDYKIVILFGIIVLYIYYYFNLILNIGYLIQVIGFITFPLALILYNERKKYFLSLVGIGCVTLGTSIILYYSFIQKEVIGTDISYTLLTLTVFTFYLKNIKKYL